MDIGADYTRPASEATASAAQADVSAPVTLAPDTLMDQALSVGLWARASRGSCR